MVDAYCVRCKAKTQMKVSAKTATQEASPRQEKTSKGGDIIKGYCSKCDCKVVKFGTLPADEELPKAA